MPITNISPQEAHSLLEKQQATLFDVRTAGEFATIRIADAPLVRIHKGHPIPTSIPTDKQIILYCASGRRSLIAAEQILKEYPDAKIANLDGGIKAWEAQGLPVIRHPRRISLDRQAQIAAGLLVLIGTLLGMMTSAWLIVPIFVGCGLIFSGFSGLCGMAALLSRAPWNANAQPACNQKTCSVKKYHF